MPLRRHLNFTHPRYAVPWIRARATTASPRRATLLPDYGPCFQPRSVNPPEREGLAKAVRWGLREDCGRPVRDQLRRPEQAVRLHERGETGLPGVPGAAEGDHPILSTTPGRGRIASPLAMGTSELPAYEACWASVEVKGAGVGDPGKRDDGGAIGVQVEGDLGGTSRPHVSSQRRDRPVPKVHFGRSAGAPEGGREIHRVQTLVPYVPIVRARRVPKYWVHQGVTCGRRRDRDIRLDSEG